MLQCGRITISFTPSDHSISSHRWILLFPSQNVAFIKSQTNNFLPSEYRCITVLVKGDHLQIRMAERVRELVQLASFRGVRDEGDLRCIRFPISSAFGQDPFYV